MSQEVCRIAQEGERGAGGQEDSWRDRGHRRDSAPSHAIYTNYPFCTATTIIDPPYPMDPEAKSSSDPPQRRAAAPGAAGQKINVGVAFAQCGCKGECTSLAQSTKVSKSLPVSACLLKPATTQNAVALTTSVLGSNRLRPSLLPFFEYACSATSMLGQVHAELKVPHVRLWLNGLDVQDPRIAEQLFSQLRGPSKKHLWASLPCTSGCPWHRIGLALQGASYRKKHAKEVAESRTLFKQCQDCSHLSGLAIQTPGSERMSKSFSRTPASCL